MLVGDPDIVTYTTYVGQGAPRFWLGLNPVLPNPNFAQIVIVTKDLAARERVKARLERALADGAVPRRGRESTASTSVRRSASRFSSASSVPIPMKVRGIADQVRAVMAENPKIIDPHLNWGEQVKSIRLEVDQDRARALGLTPQDVSQMLQTLLVGLHRHAISRGHRAHRRRRPRCAGRAARARPSARRSPSRPATASRCRSRRSRGCITNTRSRSCGGATATPCSPCAATSSTTCRRPT